VPTARVQFVQQLVQVCLAFLRQLCQVELYSYQIDIADRIFFSLLMEDTQEITIETARQSGKTEALACICSTAMVLFPKLAKLYPDDPVISKFKHGIMIGVFAPTDDQASTIFSRIQLRLGSEEAKELMLDPEIDDEMIPTGSEITMRSHSFCRKQTAFPKAKIESKTYHLIVIDEAQDADSETVRRRIHPMMAAVGGSIVKIGTPTSHKSDYYEALIRNRSHRPVHGKRNYFAYDWKRAAKENKRYAAFVRSEIDRIGEDSDEFQMAYALRWMLERGMFMTDERINDLSDVTMERVEYYYDTPIVCGLDVASKHDSTVLTAVFVDWDHPDEFHLYYHKVLNWLEMHGENWESQYRQICGFCAQYRVMRLGVDAQGMGGPVAERLQVLLPHIEVVPLPMNPADQSERWTHLTQLIQRDLLGWPAGPRTRRHENFKRFITQMSQVEKEYKGKYMLVGSPRNEKNTHDDYIDSLALACSLSLGYGQEVYVEQWSENPFYPKRNRRGSELVIR
jgi:hypothetical protein